MFCLGQGEKILCLSSPPAPIFLEFHVFNFKKNPPAPFLKYESGFLFIIFTSLYYTNFIKTIMYNCTHIFEHIFEKISRYNSLFLTKFDPPYPNIVKPRKLGFSYR